MHKMKTLIRHKHVMSESETDLQRVKWLELARSFHAMLASPEKNFHQVCYTC